MTKQETKFTPEFEEKADALSAKVEAIVLAVFDTKEEDEEIKTLELVTEMFVATHVIATEAMPGPVDMFDTIALLNRIAADLQFERMQAEVTEVTEGEDAETEVSEG